MTPAKLIALMERRRDAITIYEGPIALVASLIYNSNRDPGDKETGRQPAKALTIEDMRLYKTKRKGKSLAAKDRVDHNLHGAEADPGEWRAYTGKTGKSTKPKVRK